MAGNSPQQKKKTKLPEMDKFHEIEVQQVFETMVNIQNLRIQSGIFFATTNLGAMGVAFSSEKAGIILFASLLIIAFIIIDGRGRSSFAALKYRALQLQQKFAPNEPDTFLNLVSVGFLDEELRNIETLEDRESRLSALRFLPFKSPGLVSFWFPLLGFIIEIAIGLILLLIFKWSLF